MGSVPLTKACADPSGSLSLHYQNCTFIGSWDGVAKGGGDFRAKVAMGKLQGRPEMCFVG